MFTSICILVAALLAALSIKQFKIVGIIVALEFALHKIAFVLLSGFSAQAWVFYFCYGLIQVAAISILRKTNCHFVIMGLMAINLFFNFYTAYLGLEALNSTVYWNKFMSIYAIYAWFVGTIMIFELLYLGWLNSYVSKCMRGADDSDYNFIDRLFRVACPSIPCGKVS